MTPRAQQEAIAEFVGWTPPTADTRGCWTTPYGAHGSGIGLPDYSTSLDAIAEAEAKLTTEEHYTFRCRLWEITDAKTDASLAHLTVNGEEHNRRYASATAEQRAEALLRAIGKWTDADPEMAAVMKLGKIGGKE